MPLGDGIAFSSLQDMTWHPFSQGSLPQDVAPHFLTFTKECCYLVQMKKQQIMFRKCSSIDSFMDIEM